MNVRGEGFEKYIENVFGQDGSWSRSKIEKKLESWTRFLRSPSDSDNIKSKVDEIDYDNDGLKHRKPLLDLGMKIFGNEISYFSAEGDDEILEAVKNLNPLHHVQKVLSGKVIYNHNKLNLF